MTSWKDFVETFDERREIAIPGDKATTVKFCADHFLALARQAIEERGQFTVALSGGSTPKAIFQQLAEGSEDVAWDKVFVFWSDERSVPPDDPESNYGQAMQAGLSKLGVPEGNVFRMIAEENIDENALAYERKIQERVPNDQFDLVMLGMGDDGHVASLFPNTHGLNVKNRLVIANYVPEKNTWRMSFTFDLINQAHQIVLYVMGAGKAAMVKRVLNGEHDFVALPAQGVGTAAHSALWILDQDAARDLREQQT